MTFGTTPDSLEQCVEEWLAAYASGDPENILPFYHSPLLAITPDGWHWLTATGEVKEFMMTFVAELDEQEYASSETESLQIHRMTESDALVSLALAQNDTRGATVDRVGYTDLFHHTDAGWKAAVAIVHEADAVLS